MSITKIRGSSQIQAGTITNNEVSVTAGIQTSKLADGAEFIKRDGSVAFTTPGTPVNFGGKRLYNLGAPSDPSDAVRLSDLEATAVGLDFKASCRAATTGAVTLSGDPGSTIDNVPLVNGNRVLVKNQAGGSEFQHGIWVVNTTGPWTRASDADSNAEVTAGLFVFVEEGDINGDTGWVLITNNPINLGVTPLTFTQFSGAGSTTATNYGVSGVGVYDSMNGAQLRFRNINTAAGGVVSVALDNTNHEIDLDITAASLTNSHISNSANIARTKIANGSANHVVVNDGSGTLSSEAQLAVSRGGTGSGTALVNNRVIVSSASKIVEAAAITANRALVSDASGIPTHSSVTTTELGYVSGVTSAIQTQLGTKLTTANYIVRETPTGFVDGSNSTFVLANTPLAGTEQVFLNGILQEPGAGNDYTIATATITFVTPPLVNDKIRVTYLK